MLKLDCKEMPKQQLDFVIKDYIMYLFEVAKEYNVNSITLFNPDNTEEIYEFSFSCKHNRECVFKCGLFSAKVVFNDMDRVGALGGFFKDRTFIIGKLGD